MNDAEPKRIFKRVLDQHTRILGPLLSITNPALCLTNATEPRCEKKLSPVDLFNILEPSETAVGKTKTPGTTRLPVQTGGGYTTIGAYDWYDRSFVYGNGECVPALLHEEHLPGIDDGLRAESKAAADCHNIITAMSDSLPGVRSVMKHAFQPVGKNAVSQDILEDFEFQGVVNGLVKGAGKLDSLTENDWARVLYCEDSLDLQVCGTIKTVYSTEGFSIGINVQNQEDFLLQDSFSQDFHNSFINKTIR